MAVKALLRVCGVRFDVDTVSKVAFVEITVLALLYLILILMRYFTNILPHDLFVELLLIIGVGMAFDHYFMTVLSLGKQGK